MDDEFYGRMRRAVVAAGCFFVRNWLWFVGGAFVYFLFAGDVIARFVGYGEAELSPGARLLRDVIIGGIAAVGLVMAFWRNFLLDRQSKAAAKTVAHARDRMENDQFKEAVELMAKEDKEGNPDIAARVGGIYVLRDLALHEERWQEFAPRVIRILMAYVKENAQRTAKQFPEKLRQDKESRNLGDDVTAGFMALEKILDRHGKVLEEQLRIFRQDLVFTSCDFSNLAPLSVAVPKWSRYVWVGVSFHNAKAPVADMVGATLRKTNFENAVLIKADMRGAKLQSSTMAKAILQGADLRGVNLSAANLSGVNLTGAIFNATDLRRTKTDGADFPPLEELHGRIWHSNQKELKGVKPRADDAEWGDILHEFASEGTALAGLLTNFGNIETPLTEPGRKLREAMINMLNENRIPDDFPFWAEYFLRGLNPNGTDKGN